MSDSTQFIQFANVVSGETLAYIQQGKGKKKSNFYPWINSRITSLRRISSPIFRRLPCNKS